MGTRLAAGVQAWMSQVVLPAGFALIALRLVGRASPGWTGRSVAAAGLLLGLAIGLRPSLLEGSPGGSGSFSSPRQAQPARRS